MFELYASHPLFEIYQLCLMSLKILWNPEVKLVVALIPQIFTETKILHVSCLTR